LTKDEESSGASAGAPSMNCNPENAAIVQPRPREAFFAPARNAPPKALTGR
jgi:hypothetical protein